MLGLVHFVLLPAGETIPTSTKGPFELNSAPSIDTRAVSSSTAETMKLRSEPVVFGLVHFVLLSAGETIPASTKGTF